MLLKFNLTESIQSSLREVIQTGHRPISDEFIPIIYIQQTIGYLAPSTFRVIKDYLAQEQNAIAYIEVVNDQLQLINGSPHDLTIELQIIAQYLRSKNIITYWRDENFSFVRDDGHEIFQLERAAFRYFGFQSKAVHINGFTSNGSIWLAKRSANKAIDPGLLDNMTAGGISSGESIQSCAQRELWEEAGIAISQLKNLYPVGLLELKRPIPPLEVHHETIYTFDIKLQDDWEPTNHDGEVDHFTQYSVDDVIELIFTDALTKDAAIVTSDFILRHV